MTVFLERHTYRYKKKIALSEPEISLSSTFQFAFRWKWNGAETIRALCRDFKLWVRVNQKSCAFAAVARVFMGRTWSWRRYPCRLRRQRMAPPKNEKRKKKEREREREKKENKKREGKKKKKKEEKRSEWFQFNSAPSLSSVEAVLLLLSALYPQNPPRLFSDEKLTYGDTSHLV